MNNFADRLIESIRRKKSCVCFGRHPRLDLIPAEITSKASSPSQAIYEFNKAIIDLVKDDAVAVKPQSAFYEQYHAEGVKCFFDTLDYARQQGLIVVADVKRSDIASTAEAYARTFLKDSPADAITVNPYLGIDSLEPFIKLCDELGKGLFVLVKTSNPGSKDFQDALLKDNRKLYELVAEKVGHSGNKLVGKEGYSSVGAVVGATFPAEAKAIRQLMPKAIFLVPGYGAQGAKAADLKDYFNKGGLGALINAARSITYAYKNPKTTNWQDAVKHAVKEMNKEINGVIR